MLAGFRKLRADEPGKRFERAHERHRISSAPIRILAIIFGLGIAVSGAVTFWLPGPNIVLVVGGLGIVSAQWRAFARLLDWMELRAKYMRDHWWRPLPKTIKRLIALVLWLAFTAACLGVLYLVWQAGLLPAWMENRIPSAVETRLG